MKTVITNPDIMHKNIYELGLKEKYDCVVMSIQRKDGIIFPISKNTQFKIGDIVTVVCYNKNIKKVLGVLAANK